MRLKRKRKKSLLAESDTPEDKAAIVITLGRPEVRQLFKTVNFHLEHWQSYPGRPEEERNRLLAIKQFLNVALMEFSFHSQNK